MVRNSKVVKVAFLMIWLVALAANADHAVPNYTVNQSPAGTLVQGQRGYWLNTPAGGMATWRRGAASWVRTPGGFAGIAQTQFGAFGVAAVKGVGVLVTGPKGFAFFHR